VTATAAGGRIVVVGGGLAGARACEELRAAGHRGEILLVGAEDRPPYDRPPLSKEVLVGKADDPSLGIDLAALGVDVRLGVRATGLGTGQLATTAGALSWDGLVLATGAEPLRLAGDGDQHVVRTVDDALRLRAALTPGARVAVVGAGWIGAEVATAARRRKCVVTVVEATAAPHARLLGDGPVGRTLGRRLLAWYAAAGVELRLGALVAAVAPDGLLLADGTSLAADVVVTGVGVRPATDWLARSGVRRDARGAVQVDALLRADGFERVVAVGDCAAWWSGRFRARMSAEHWDEAFHAPETAARSLLAALGGGEPPPPYDPVPYFWSEQLGHRVQWAGHRPAVGGAVPVLRDDPSRGWSACWLDAAGRLAAVLTVDRPRDLLQGRKLIAAGHRPDPQRLADPAVALRDT
jgi:NADPH-dependent 2,4-dienoyl-CoA reductase/sulfur reductase-like enzyme